LPQKQSGQNKYPCAMSYFNLDISPGKTVVFNSVTGHIDSEQKS
jgi:hypothetical protein